MKMVGRFGNFLSQSVLEIAVPFHPFGGAIDVIVVQQHDGTFRTTPWHVQFGKFQGLLKGSEKVVITVNGVEADFHMYLDSSGEAYFMKEVDSSEGIDGVDVVNDSVVDDRTNGDGENNGNEDVLDSCIQERPGDEMSALYSQRNEMEESNGKRRICFEDEQSPLDDSIEMPDDRSNHINIGTVNSHDQKSEVIVESVDGHVPAYFSASENVTEKVQLAPTQNRPGLGDRRNFNEDNEKFDAGEDPCNYNNLNASRSDVDLYNICSANNDTDDFEYQLEVCEGDGEHVFHSQNQVDITSGGDIDQVSNSCMKLIERGQLDSEDVASLLVADNSEAKSDENLPRVDKAVEERAFNDINNDLPQPSGSDSSSTPAEKPTNSETMDQNDPSIYFDSDNTQLKNDHEDGRLETSVLDDECTDERELLKFRAENSDERIDSLQTTSKLSFAGLEIHLLIRS